MAQQSWKSFSAFFTYREATPFTADADEFFEGRGRMMIPEPEYQVESDYNKLGSGEHGRKNEIQAVWTPWSYTCDRMSEIMYFLSYFQGNTSENPGNVTGTAYSHRYKHLPVADRTMPTFGFQIGPAANLTVVSGCMVNEFSIAFANGGNGVVEATFSGFGNRHQVTDGSIAALSAGTMSTGEIDFSAEPLLNYKCLNFWMGDSYTDPGKSSVDYEGVDLGATVTNLTTLLNSITIGGSNGMSAADMARASGCGVINDRTRGDRRYTLEFSLRKDDAILNTDTLRLADTQKAYELQFFGPDIEASTPYAIDWFFPVAQILQAPEDDASPVSKAYTTEVFEDTNGDSMIVYAQSAVSVAYNSTKA